MTHFSGWNQDISPYHAGEQELQERVGRKDRQEAIARQIHTPYMPDQHREFYQQLPFIIVGSVDEQGWPWASILFGKPGFMTTPTEKILRLDAVPIQGDPLNKNIELSAPLGLLGIELPTRRRNRMNGFVIANETVKNKENVLDIKVSQSYGNCPQYIQTRSIDFVREPKEDVDIVAEHLTGLDQSAKDLIRRSDTFYVASHNPNDDIKDTGGVDVSHRGGKPGFIKIEGDTLTIPDYMGNFAFNTLGNFLVNPKAGLLFIDYDNGDILYLTGTTELIWDITPELEAFRGAERAWTFSVKKALRLKNASPLNWSFDDYSPNIQLTDDWKRVSATLAAQKQHNAWFPFKVTKIVDESDIIRSFYLQPSGDSIKLDYQPGQHITLRVTPEGHDKPLLRNYTLSSAMTESNYRISVKREDGNEHPKGVVSSYFHEHIKIGDIIEIQAPSGQFIFDATETRPAVLLAGGVGITPMMAMLNVAISEGIRSRYIRPITLIHSVKTVASRAFTDEISKLRMASGGIIEYCSIVSKPEDGKQSGKDFHLEGRLSKALLQKLLAIDDYEFYLCGPEGFMQSAYDVVRNLGVNDEDIFSENFGPSKIIRIPDSGVTSSSQFEPIEEANDAIITFEDSKFKQAWNTEDGTLLEFAENHGLTPDFGCRDGNCGNCAVKIQSGEVSYRDKPSFEVKEGDALLCCSRPAKNTKNLVLSL